MVKLQASKLLLLPLVLAAAAHRVGSRAPAPPSQRQPTIVRDPVKYERGDCLYETVVCLREDSCGPLLRLVHAYCYETPEYLQVRSDGARLACDASCAVLLSVLFNTGAGARLRECNYSNYQFWSDLVIRKQFACAPLLPRAQRLLQRALAGAVRTECWLAGLLCARDFSCRSTLMSILDLPCYDGPCSPECAARMTNFAGMFSDVFHTFLSCLCGQELAAACPTLPSGYLSNRSSALDGVAFVAPLDSLVEQLGRGAIREQVGDSIWLLRVFEHSSYCRSLKAIISDPKCVPPLRLQPAVSEPICAMESVYHLPSTAATSTTAPSSTTTTTSSSSSKSSQLQTQWQQPTAVYPKGAAAAASDATVAVTGAQQQLAGTAAASLLLACCSLLTRLTLQ